MLRKSSNARLIPVAFGSPEWDQMLRSGGIPWGPMNSPTLPGTQQEATNMMWQAIGQALPYRSTLEGSLCTNGWPKNSSSRYRRLSIRLPLHEWSELQQQQQVMPVELCTDGLTSRRWWPFQDELHWEDEGYKAIEVRALVLQQRKRQERRIGRAFASLEAESSPRSRQAIPDDVKQYVWQRDDARCVICGSRKNLEFDHIIPLSMGGSNTARNIQLLCETCNRAKGGNLA